VVDGLAATDPELIRDQVPVTLPLVALLVASVIGSLTLRQRVRYRSIFFELTPRRLARWRGSKTISSPGPPVSRQVA
jgi:hypothetical protein